MAIQKITAKIIADGAIIAADVADGSITNAKIDSVANTKITGLVTSAQIANVANTQLTGLVTSAQIASVNGAIVTANTIANSAFQTGSVENYLSAQSLGIGMRNRIINGAMLISQRNGTTATTITDATDFFGPDRWKYYRNVGGTFTTTQSSTAPTGHIYSMLTTASTGASPSAAQLNFFQQIIEGLNITDLGWGTADAQTVTLSFWVRSSITGTYAIAISNDGLNRAYVATYTISAANTWEQKSITIPGDTSGTWLTTNGAGIRVYWDLGSGSNYNLTAGTWGGTWGLRTSGSTTWGATTGATFYLTGVQLEVGSTATPFERRMYGVELNNCFRYYYKYPGGPNIHGFLYNSPTHIGTVFFPITMRTSPTIADLTGQYGSIENPNVSGMYMLRASSGTYLTTYSANAEL